MALRLTGGPCLLISIIASYPRLHVKFGPIVVIYNEGYVIHMNKHKNLHLPFLRYSRKKKKKTSTLFETSLTEDNRFFRDSPKVARTEGCPPKSNNVLATMGESKRAQFTQMVFCLRGCIWKWCSSVTKREKRWKPSLLMKFTTRYECLYECSISLDIAGWSKKIGTYQITQRSARQG